MAITFDGRVGGGSGRTLTFNTPVAASTPTKTVMLLVVGVIKMTQAEWLAYGLSTVSYMADKNPQPRDYNYSPGCYDQVGTGFVDGLADNVYFSRNLGNYWAVPNIGGFIANEGPNYDKFLCDLFYFDVNSVFFVWAASTYVIHPYLVGDQIVFRYPQTVPNTSGNTTVQSDIYQFSNVLGGSVTDIIPGLAGTISQLFYKNTTGSDGFGADFPNNSDTLGGHVTVPSFTTDANAGIVLASSYCQGYITRISSTFPAYAQDPGFPVWSDPGFTTFQTYTMPSSQVVSGVAFDYLGKIGFAYKIINGATTINLAAQYNAPGHVIISGSPVYRTYNALEASAGSGAKMVGTTGLAYCPITSARLQRDLTAESDPTPSGLPTGSGTPYRAKFKIHQ